jgi:hypothetical protein
VNHDEERDVARKDPRQLELPFRMTIQQHAYNLGRQARRDHPENYDRNGHPSFN